LLIDDSSGHRDQQWRAQKPKSILVEYAVPGEWRLTEAIGSTQEAADIAGVL